jgi:hypothetical protein
MEHARRFLGLRPPVAIKDETVAAIEDLYSSRWGQRLLSPLKANCTIPLTEQRLSPQIVLMIRKFRAAAPTLRPSDNRPIALQRYDA